ncbi:hypothetical protein [Enterococcus gallinarum]|uniref:hypothetical protein n=1 Tax=Enterococcus gallinarum TaxID=1353 RepID=UPI00288FEF88|nr:hypothetical protein [Enterococcus gallinarum]MDT2685806.1 hypothetical protein [Enterococcus gallinarum]
MQDLFEILFKFHEDAPPFIAENEDGESYVLMGQSDKATSDLFDYGKEYGKCKLTAKNHSQTLISLMNYMILIDTMSEHEDLSFEDIEIISFLQFQFMEVLSNYFIRKIDSYSHEIALKFLLDNPHLVNEALYNITKDKEVMKGVDYQSIVDGLEGTQFEDPYINIAFDIATEFKLRPMDVIENWSTSELVVTFAKIANIHSLDSFLNWKYSQKNAPKRKPPKKQVFFFKKLGEEEDNNA